MPDAKAPAAPSRAPAITAAACAAACLAAAVAALRVDEGKRNVGYLDIARVPTVCYGHTGRDVAVDVRHTDAACEALLSGDAGKAQAGVLACVPGLGTRPMIWAASTRMAFNTGVSAFCGSSAARAFRAGNWPAGCDAMLLWDKAVVSGRKVAVAGLTARRQRERAQCLAGVAA